MVGVLNARFFELLADRFRERLCFVVARAGDEIVAGTVNVQKGDALYGRYWGALRPLRHLHFNVCYYAGIEQCVEQGLRRFEPGAGGEYKKLRGFDAVPTWSFHWLADPRLRSAVERFLERERTEPAMPSTGTRPTAQTGETRRPEWQFQERWSHVGP